MFAGVLQFKQSTQQILGCLADQNGVGPGERLQPCGEIGGFANDRALLRGADPDDFADHDKAGGDPNPCLHPGLVRQFDVTDFRRMPSAARTARSAASSKARGKPNRPERHRP